MTRTQAKAFRHLIDVLIGKLNSDDALAMLILFHEWQPKVEYEFGARCRERNQLYKCKQAHTSQEGWPPHLTPSLWEMVQIEEWVQWEIRYGTGWPKNAKVIHNGQKWISDYEANTWEPGVFGWSLYDDNI